MPRYANPYPNGPYPTDPTFGIAAESIARALFGDPQARAEQEQKQAEMERIKAATGFDLSRTRGVDLQNNASAGLPAILAQLVAPQQAPQQSPIGDISTLAEIATGTQPMPTATPAVPFDGINVDGKQPVNYDEQLRAILPQLIGSMGQMQGDKIDPNKIVGTLAAMFGTDGIARRGMIAQGNTPGKDFALDTERADEIAGNGFAAKKDLATAVATINNESDIPVANIRAGATVDAARIGGTSRENVARIGNEGKMDVAVYKGGGGAKGERNNNLGNLRDGAFARSQDGYVGADGTGFAVFATPEHGNKAQERLLANSYIGKGFDTPAKIVAKYAPSNENSNASMNNYAAYIARKAGVDVNGIIPANKVGVVAQAMREFENGSRSGGKPAKAAKTFTVAGPVQKSLNEGVTTFIKEMGLGAMSPRNKRRMIARATSYYQQTGNLAGSLVRAEEELKKSYERNKAAPKQAAGWGPIKVVK